MIALIVAFDKNRVIGMGGKIPWKIEGEQKRFKELTLGNTVIMGRKTFEEIGRPLPHRFNIVVSKTSRFESENCITVNSLDEAFKMSKGDVFISGGATLYEESLPRCQKLYITEIDASFEGDVFFPSFDESKYKKEIIRHVEGDIPYTYLTYTKI